MCNSISSALFKRLLAACLLTLGAVRLHAASGTGMPDYADNVVNGASDLKDFFPVFLDIKPLLTALPPSGSVKYKLKQEDEALNFVYTNLTRAKAYGYLSAPSTGFGPSFAEPAATATTQQIKASGIELNTEFLNRITSQDQGVILIEGRAPSAKPLILVVEKESAIIAVVSLPLLHFDVHYDADNTTVEGYPDASKGDLKSAERRAQNSSDTQQYPGVRIYANLLDVDTNGVVGYADGIDKFGNGNPNANWKFEPFLIEVTALGSFPSAKFVFDYSGSDPDQMIREGAGITARYVIPPGKFLRIWRKDGDQVRRPQSTHEGGDYIRPGLAYTPQQLGWQQGDRHVRLYIEAVDLPPSDQASPVEVKFFPDGSVGAPNSFQATIRVVPYYISRENPGIDNMGI